MNTGISRKIAPMEVPVRPLMTNSSSPCGGSASPTIMFSMITTPKCTRSMPSPAATGTSSGTITSRIVISSKATASSSSITFTASRNVTGPNCQPSSVARMALGRPSLATA